MNIFIDTSNKKLLLGLIDNELNVVDFQIKDNNNMTVKNTLDNLDKFLNKNKTSIKQISGWFLTTGPGSFTGVKVGLNIIKSFNLVEKVRNIWTIDTFKLLRDQQKDYTAIAFGKNKFYFKNNWGRSKVKIVTNLKDLNINKARITEDYKKFTKETLQKKIDDKEFKIVKDINKIKLEYISNF